MGKAIPALDSLKPGDVVVHSTDPTDRIVQWGGLMATASKMRGAVGSVVDGLTRDTKELLELDFPVSKKTKPSV